MKKEFLEIGKIVGVHGLKGFMKVQYWCDDSDFFCSFKKFYLNENTVLDVESSKPHGNIILLKAKGISTIEEAESMRGKTLLIKREDAILEEGRHFIEEIIGCSVYDSENGELLGKLTDVTDNPANDIWHIEKEGREYLFPAIDEFIVSVDVETEKIVIKVLKGIFDDED